MDNTREDQPVLPDKPRYGISEVSHKTGISAFTLRYYDKCGFFPNLFRDKNSVRKFSDNDIKFLNLVDSLRKSGLSIEGIQYYVRLHTQGVTTRAERHRILESQKTTLEYQLAEIEESLATLTEEKDALDEQ